MKTARGIKEIPDRATDTAALSKDQTTGSASSRNVSEHLGTDIVLFAVIICAAALLGVLTRPLGFLAAFWPANALFLGLLLVRPAWRHPLIWIAGTTGYLIAGAIAGDSLVKNLWLTLTNLSGIATGLWLFLRLNPDHLRLRQPSSMLYIFMSSAGAALVASCLGMTSGIWLYGASLAANWGYWFTSEILNYVITLPLVLATGHLKRNSVQYLYRTANITPRRLLPVLGLCFSIGVSAVIGGSGAIAFAVPALLWCSLSYSIFTNAVLMFLFSATMVILQASGVFSQMDSALDNTLSFRLGITMLAVGPLTVASISAAQKDLLRKLNHAASTDNLTGALRRGRFLGRARTMLGSATFVSFLMIDIDHFKRVNDEHGHPAGDKVLRAIASTMAGTLGDDELFGRLGGEEFAVVVPNLSARETLALAERLRSSVEDLVIELKPGKTLATSVSIGVVHRKTAPDMKLSMLLSAADAALYDAKKLGRNRVISAL